MPAWFRLLAFVLLAVLAAPAWAQWDGRGGPHDGRPMTPDEIKERLARTEGFLQSVDVNHNSIIEAEEVQGYAGRYMERILGRAGLEPRYPMTIAHIRERLTAVYNLAAAGQPQPGQPTPPGAIPPEVQAKIKELATSFIQKHDREKKGKLVKDEWPAQCEWGAFEQANRQGGSFVTFDELVTHLTDLYRQNKLNLGLGLGGTSAVPGFGTPMTTSQPLVPGFGIPAPVATPATATQAGRPGAPPAPSDHRGPPQMKPGSPPPLPPEIAAKIKEMAYSIIAKYDREKKGKLTKEEWPRGPWGTFDEANRQGGTVISSEELIIHLSDLYRQNKLYLGGSGAKPYHFASAKDKLPKGLPEWFVAKDKDADGQISMAEFSSDWTTTRVEEFTRYDANHDGVITAAECLAVEKAAKERAATSERQRR